MPNEPLKLHTAPNQSSSPTGSLVQNMGAQAQSLHHVGSWVSDPPHQHKQILQAPPSKSLQDATGSHYLPCYLYPSHVLGDCKCHPKAPLLPWPGLDQVITSWVEFHFPPCEQKPSWMPSAPLPPHGLLLIPKHARWGSPNGTRMCYSIHLNTVLKNRDPCQPLPPQEQGCGSVGCGSHLSTAPCLLLPPCFISLPGTKHFALYLVYR